MSGSRAVSCVTGSADNWSIEGQLCGLSIQSESDTVHQPMDIVEAGSKEHFQILIGQHVCKRFADLMSEGVVESHDNVSEMFKVVYTNGHSEEMTWEDLVKYLVPHELSLPPYTNELANNDHETGEHLALVAPALPTYKRRRTKIMSSRTKRKENANDICPPRQAGRRGRRRSTRDDGTLHLTRRNEISEVVLRRSTRKRKELGYTYCEVTTDEDEYEDSEPDYPLPPIIQVPWVDMGDEEDTRKVPMKGLSTAKGFKGPAKRQWVSLRMCATSCQRNGHKKASDGSEV